MPNSKNLNINIGAKTEGLIRELNKASVQVGKFQKTIKNVGSSIGVIFGGAAVIGAISKSVEAFDKQAAAVAKVQQAIKSTGGSAKLTLDELTASASDLQSKTIFGDEEILEGATAQLLTFTNIAGDNFLRTQKLALDLSTVLGTDLKSSSIQLGKALNDPVANLSALSRSGIQFSKEQKELIKGLAESNKLYEAQSIILEEIEKQYGGQAEAVAKVGMGPMKQLINVVGDLNEMMGEVFANAMLPVATWAKDMADSLIPKLSEKLIDQKNEFNALTNALINNNNNQRLKKDLIKELNDKYKQYLGNINLEKASLQDISSLLERVNKQFEKKIATQLMEEDVKDLTKDLVGLYKEELRAAQEIEDIKSRGLKSDKLSFVEKNKYVTGEWSLVDIIKQRELGLQGIRNQETDINKELDKTRKMYDEIISKIGYVEELTSDTTTTNIQGDSKGVVSNNDSNKLILTQARGLRELTEAKLADIDAEKMYSYQTQINNRLQEERNELLDQYRFKTFAMTDAYIQLGEAIVQNMNDGRTALIALGDTTLEIIKQIIRAKLAEAIANMATAESKKGILGLATAFVGITALQAIWNNKMPKLAKGGLAYGPTMAVVGDNVGAKSDPEVIAPLSKLKKQLSGGPTVIFQNAVVGNEMEVGRKLERIMNEYSRRK